MTSPAPDTPPVTPPATPAPLAPRTLWYGLAAAALSLAVWGEQIRRSPEQLWAMLDLRCYYEAGQQVLHGPGLYSSLYTQLHIPFIYPPFAGLAFSWAAHAGFPAVRWAMTVSSVLGLGAVCWIAWGLVGHARGRGRLGAALGTAALGLWLEPFQQNLCWGQVNVLLMLLVMADYAQPDRSRWKGVGIGLAAGFKITPAVHVLYLLATRRFRQAGTAAGVFAASAGLGALALPRESDRYWLGGELFGVGGRSSVSNMSNQSLHALVGRLLHDGPHTTAVWLAVSLPVLAAGIGLAARWYRRGHELIGVLATAITGMLVSPISWSHHWVWIVLGLVAALDRARCAARAGRVDALLAPLALMLVFGAWSGLYAGAGPVIPLGVIWNTPFVYPEFYAWHGTQWIQGNLYVLLGLAFLVGLASPAGIRNRTSAPGRDHGSTGSTHEHAGLPHPLAPDRGPRAIPAPADGAGRAVPGGISTDVGGVRTLASE